LLGTLNAGKRFFADFNMVLRIPIMVLNRF